MSFRSMLLSTICLLLTTSFLQAQTLQVPTESSGIDHVAEAWISTYDDPDHHEDAANAIALDRDGNVFVTGYSITDPYFVAYDCTTIKYDGSGNEIWVVRQSWDQRCTCNAVEVDTDGNVYVAGWQGSDDWGGGFATIKYAPNGEKLWQKGGEPIAWEDDGASDLALDSHGNVLVTGSIGDWRWPDYYTIKYDPEGNELWADGYNGFGDHVSDYANAIVVDVAGNSYVTGGSVGPSGMMDYTTIKYAPSGTRQWVQRYDGPINGGDQARDITLDNAGFIYITGQSQGDGTGHDFVTVKYDFGGNEIWVARYNGPGNGDDKAQALIIDNTGNVFVTGESPGITGLNDYATVKYNSNGDELWVMRYDGPAGKGDSPKDIALDRDGNIYVTGSVTVPDNPWDHFDYCTIKYSPEGEELWVIRHDNENNDDRAHALAVDLLGNVFVTGYHYSSPGFLDFATLKYKQFQIGINQYPPDSLMYYQVP